MSRRPSPSKSCENFKYVEGMNCGWPSAPAHDPRSRSSSMSPRLTISSALNNSFLNIGARRGSRQAAFEVRRQIERELGLRAIALEDLADRRQIGERAVDDVLTNAARERLGAHLDKPLRERRR